MECNIYDGTLTKIGVINDFVSMQWSEAYCDVGSFYIVCNKDDEALSLLQIGNFVGVRRYDTLMIIYSVKDQKGQIWAYGAEAKWLLTKRVYDGTLVCRNVEDTLKQAVRDTNPYSIIQTEADQGLTETIRSQRSYLTLFDMSKAWCDMVGYGFRLVHDRSAKKLYYRIYEGQTQNNAVFSERYRNLQNLIRTQSEKQTANVAIVLGSGEGEERTKLIVGDTTSTGLARKEICIDARDLQKDENETQEEYEEKLEARGLEKLAEAAATDDITFDIDSTDFGTVFNLGDLIRCNLPEYGYYESVRVTGFTTTYENNAEKTALTLGTAVIRSSVSSPLSSGGGATGVQGAKGDPGDCNFATFEIDPTTGILSATYTTNNSDLVFSINGNGYLEVAIL